MEDALAPFGDRTCHTLSPVLILVLMEDALALFFAWGVVKRSHAS